MIEPATGFPDLFDKLSAFLVDHAASLPEHTRNAVLANANHPSPVDRIVNTAEALYAAKGDLTKEGRVITAQLAQFAAINGFHNMGERGQKIFLAMNRMGNFAAPVGVQWPAADQDPEPLERFAAPAEDEVEAPVDEAPAE